MPLDAVLGGGTEAGAATAEGPNPYRRPRLVPAKSYGLAVRGNASPVGQSMSKVRAAEEVRSGDFRRAIAAESTNEKPPRVPARAASIERGRRG
ncbi:MAG: hypothetical protein KatS3mg111_1507 [Pirellulaceae bacterium]|nr:MAG: hypothetical protein KatS3mg111_1507 [Pirellulaceae bacterium]